MIPTGTKATTEDVIKELEEMREIGESVDHGAPSAQHPQHPAVIIGRILGRIDVLLVHLKS